MHDSEASDTNQPTDNQPIKGTKVKERVSCLAYETIAEKDEPQLTSDHPSKHHKSKDRVAFAAEETSVLNDKARPSGSRSRKSSTQSEQAVDGNDGGAGQKLPPSSSFIEQQTLYENLSNHLLKGRSSSDQVLHKKARERAENSHTKSDHNVEKRAASEKGYKSLASVLKSHKLLGKRDDYQNPTASDISIASSNTSVGSLDNDQTLGASNALVKSTKAVKFTRTSKIPISKSNALLGRPVGRSYLHSKTLLNDDDSSSKLASTSVTRASLSEESSKMTKKLPIKSTVTSRKRFAANHPKDAEESTSVTKTDGTPVKQSTSVAIAKIITPRSIVPKRFSDNSVKGAETSTSATKTNETLGKYRISSSTKSTSPQSVTPNRPKSTDTNPSPKNMAPQTNRSKSPANPKLYGSNYTSPYRYSAFHGEKHKSAEAQTERKSNDTSEPSEKPVTDKLITPRVNSKKDNPSIDKQKESPPPVTKTRPTPVLFKKTEPTPAPAARLTPQIPKIHRAPVAKPAGQNAQTGKQAPSSKRDSNKESVNRGKPGMLKSGSDEFPRQLSDDVSHIIDCIMKDKPTRPISSQVNFISISSSVCIKNDIL